MMRASPATIRLIKAAEIAVSLAILIAPHPSPAASRRL